MEQNILAVDIGGTKIATAVCTIANGHVTTIQHEASWHSREHQSFDEVVLDWRNRHPKIQLAGVGIGVPGPVNGGFLQQFGRATNLGWQLDAAALSKRFQDVPVYLCNDMESHGWGILGLKDDGAIVLNKGLPGDGCKALIAAGTGLGESIIAWEGKRHIPLGGEGGHSAFSPSTSQEDRLLVWLRKPLGGHVSWERVLGGRDGFRHLTQFHAFDTHIPIPENILREVKDNDDWGPAILQLAASGDPFCDHIVSWYATLYGREASNLAVKCVSRSGVYLGGGIAPRILPWLTKNFMTGFLDKGRFANMLSEMPVYVIVDKMNGLKGAAIGTWNMLRTQ